METNPYEKFLAPSQNDQESVTQDQGELVGPSGETLNLPPNTGASNDYGAMQAPVTNSSENPYAKYVDQTQEPQKPIEDENPYAKYVQQVPPPEQSGTTIALPQATPQQLAIARTQGYPPTPSNVPEAAPTDQAKRPVGLFEAAGRGLVGGLAKTNELMAQGVGVFPYLEDKTLQAFGVNSDIYNRYIKAVHATGLGQPGVEAEEIKPSEYLTTGGKIGMGGGEMVAPLPMMVAFGGVGAEEAAANEAFQVVKPLMTPIKQGIQSMLPMATQAGADTVQQSAQQGDDAITQAAKGIASATATAVTGAIPLAARSKIANPLTRFLEQGAYGYLTGLPVGESQKVVDSWVSGKPYIPSSWKDMAIQAIPMGLMTGLFGAIHAPEPNREPAPELAPSANPVVDSKEATINTGADQQFSPAPKVNIQTTETPVKTAEETAPIVPNPNESKITDLAIQQLEHDEGTPEHTAIQQQIDALKKGKTPPKQEPSVAEQAPQAVSGAGETPAVEPTATQSPERDAALQQKWQEVQSHPEGSPEREKAFQEYIDISSGKTKPAEALAAEAQPETQNAPEARKVEEGNQPEYQNGNEAREATETSGGNRPVTGEEEQGKEEVNAPTGRKPVGISKAAVNDQRLNRLAESLPQSERESNVEKINNALEENTNNPRNVESIISDILEKGNKARTPEEVALLTVEMNRLQLEREKLQNDFEKTQKTPSDYALLNRDIKPINDKITRLENAVDQVGTSAGRLLQMFKTMLAEDYSLVALERKTSNVLRRELTADEKTEIAKQAEEHKALVESRDKVRAKEQQDQENKALKEAYEAALKENAALKAKAKKAPKVPSATKVKSEAPIEKSIVDRLNELAEKVRQERKGKLYAKISPVDIGDIIIGASHIANGLKSFKDWSAKMVSELGDRVKPHLDKLWDAANEKIESLKAGKAPEDVRARIKAEAVAGEELSTKSVNDLVQMHLEEGVRGEDAVMKAVHDDIKDAYPNATERDVRRAFVEYGKAKFPNPDEIATQKRQLKTLVRLQESIDRLNEGLKALKNGLQRDKAIQAIREKQSILDSLLKSVKEPPTEEQLATAYSRKITALENAIEDLDKQLRTGERPAPKERVEEYVQVEQLRSEKEALQRLRDEIDKKAAPKFSPEEKENERLRKLYDKQIADLDEKLKGVEKPKPEKTAFEKNKENEQKMAERDAMRKKLKEIKKEEADRKKPSPEQKEIDRIQDQIDDVNDRIARGEKEAPTPKKEPLTEYAKKLLDDLKKAREQFKKVTGKEPESREDRYNRKRIEVIEKRIADMEDKMKRGDYSKPPKKQPPVKYPATDLAETKLKKKEKEIDDWRKEKEKSERPLWEKALRGTSENARELTIAGINVIKKIAGYMPARALATAAEEVIGYTGKNIAGFGKVRGELESGASPLKTLTALPRGYLKGAKQFLKTLQAGESDSSLLHDKSHVEQRSTNWARYIGSNLHAALKNISATGKEEVYKEHLYANAIADGLIDPSNPFDERNQMAMATLNLKAYLASKAEKLSEDNKAAQLIADGHSWLESPNKEGKLNPNSVLLSHAIKALITKGIYKVGFNFPMQSIKYMYKPFEAVARTLNAYWHGIDNISPKQMDLISAAYKMGGVGAAFMIWGALDAFRDPKDRVFGGYYQQGRGKDDAKWGTMRLFGKNIPIHFPAIEAGQFANTITRAFIRNHNKSGTGLATTSAFFEALGGLVSEAPVAGPITEISKSPSNFSNYLYQGLVPSAVRDIAKMQDVNAQGETTHRYPKSIPENIEMGIPGLREEVSQFPPSKGSKSVKPLGTIGRTSSSGGLGAIGAKKPKGSQGLGYIK